MSIFAPSLFLSKARLSFRNGFLVSGNYLEISATESPGTCAVGIAACSTPPQSRTFRELATLHTALTVIWANYSHEQARIKLHIQPELPRGSVPIHDETIIRDMKKKTKYVHATFDDISNILNKPILDRRLRSLFFGKSIWSSRATNILKRKDLEIGRAHV